MIAEHSNVLKNHLLGALPPDELKQIIPKLTLVSLKLGQVLYEADEQQHSIYFPTTTIVSLLYIMENGSTAEIGITGNDGAVGIALFMGSETTPSRAVVQSAGEAYRMDSADIKVHFRRAGAFQALLLRFTMALMSQIAQTAMCNRHHPIEQQLCRWLLLSHDRLDDDTLVMTHDLISNMLGVRREGITLAAQKLAQKKLIVNVRGTIRVIDRHGLESAACECYTVVNAEYNRLLNRGIARTFSW